MKADRESRKTKRDLIIELWEALDCESVGARELEQIQNAVAEKFGEGAVDSPASIARVLADEGAVLRHPEVLDFDTKWRERNLSELIPSDELNLSGLEMAAESIKKLDSLRKSFVEHGELRKLGSLRALVLRVKQETQALARSRIVENEERLEADELVQWLTVWLQEPDVFDDWLSLRRRSPEFIALFGNSSSEFR